jgi:hypothetical protein
MSIVIVYDENDDEYHHIIEIPEIDEEQTFLDYLQSNTFVDVFVEKNLFYEFPQIHETGLLCKINSDELRYNCAFNQLNELDTYIWNLTKQKIKIIDKYKTKTEIDISEFKDKIHNLMIDIL